MNGQQIITVYSKVAEITQEMLLAARHEDWEKLVDLESRCAEQIETLKHNDDNETLSPSAREQKIDLIKKILSDDREIRDIVQPRLARLSAMISSAGNQRKLNHAYNTGNMG